MRGGPRLRSRHGPLGGGAPTCQDVCEQFGDCVAPQPFAVEDCVTGCREQSTPGERQCVFGAGCEDAAIEACFAGPDLCVDVNCPFGQACNPDTGRCAQVNQVPACGPTCEHLAACDLIPAEAIPQCVGGCDSESTPAERGCIARSACGAILDCFGGPADPCAHLLCALGQICHPDSGQCVAANGCVGVVCRPGLVCEPRSGACVAPGPDAATPGAACDGDLECVGGDCITEAETEGALVGGFCAIDCQPGLGQCPGGSSCFQGLCFDLCNDGTRCRQGYVCYNRQDEPGACFPDCRLAGCGPDGVCDEGTGRCEGADGPVELGEGDVCDAEDDTCGFGLFCESNDGVGAAGTCVAFEVCDLSSADACGAGEACIIADIDAGSLVGACDVGESGDGTHGDACQESDADYWGDCTSGHLCSPLEEGGAAQCIGFCSQNDTGRCVGGSICTPGLLQGAPVELGLCQGDCAGAIGNGVGCGRGEICALVAIGWGPGGDEAAVGQCVASAGAGGPGAACETDPTTGVSDCANGHLCAALFEGDPDTCIELCDVDVGCSVGDCVADEFPFGDGTSGRFGVCITDGL